MNGERVETTLRFVGGWPWWAGFALAVVLGAAAWLLYRREARPLRWGLKFLLPALRTLTVMLIVLMLSGPILHHRKTIGQLSRLWLFVDGSQSMSSPIRHGHRPQSRRAATARFARGGRSKNGTASRQRCID